MIKPCFNNENLNKQNQQNFDRMSEGSGATEDGDDHLGQDYVGGGDDGRYPEKAQLEEAGYRYESALRSCGHGRAQWQVNKYTILYIVRPKKNSLLPSSFDVSYKNCV